MSESIRRLMAHMEWADQQARTALRTSSPEAALKWYAHILAAERVWYLRINGQDWTRQRVWPTLSLEECESLAAENAAQFKALALTEDALARVITYTNTQGQTFTNEVRDILLHIVLHGVHHRGQIAAALRANDTAPPVLDYIRFIREF